MINLDKSYEEFNELRSIVDNVRDLDTLVALMTNNNIYDITNDLRDTDNLIDVNYKSLCVTIKQMKNRLQLLGDAEVWSNTGRTMLNVNFYNYFKYNSRTLEDGRLYCYSRHPYDDQDYFYSYDRKIYRKGKLIREVPSYEILGELSIRDQMVLELMDLDRSLEPRMCHN